MPKIIDPSVKTQIIRMYLEQKKGRNEIYRLLKEEGVDVSSGTVSGVLKQHREQLSNEDIRVRRFPDKEFKNSKDISIEKEIVNDYSVDMGRKGLGGPLSFWFNNTEVITEEKSIDEEEGGNNSLLPSPTSMGQATTKGTSTSIESNLNPPKKIYPKSVIERKLDYERDYQWQNYGPAWYSLMSNMQREKDRRRHEMFLMDCNIKHIEEREQELRVRETKVPPEPFLQLAATLNEMKLTEEDALPWIRLVKEKAETKKVDYKTAAKQIAEELQFYQQLGGVEKQIELKNQELGLINMAAVQKERALTVLTDLLEKGVTESQIIKLVKFAGEWDRYWATNGNCQQQGNNGNLQQPIINNGNHRQQNNGSSSPGPVNNGNNGHSGNFSMNDFIRLHLLKISTTSMLNRMGISYGIKT